MSPDAEATFHCASCTLGNQVVAASDGPPFRQECRPTRVCRKNRAGRHAQREGDVAADEIQIEVNTAPRKPEGWQRYFNTKVKEFGVYAVYNYAGVDRDGITSFAASEDLERVVKVIDIALEYANDNYEADVLPGDSAARHRRA